MHKLFRLNVLSDSVVNLKTVYHQGPPYERLFEDSDLSMSNILKMLSLKYVHMLKLRLITFIGEKEFNCYVFVRYKIMWRDVHKEFVCIMMYSQ